MTHIKKKTNKPWPDKSLRDDFTSFKFHFSIYMFTLQLPSVLCPACVSTVFKYMCFVWLNSSDRDGVNITHPSVGAVQMLSQKKRIRAKLREEVRAWWEDEWGGETSRWLRPKSINLRATDGIAAPVQREEKMGRRGPARFTHVRDEESREWGNVRIMKTGEPGREDLKKERLKH